ncbi:hypothetical protein JHK86_033393 [Glycine max]|nr:hypothetical protein JHK86_033393 [Glycine max]
MNPLVALQTIDPRCGVLIKKRQSFTFSVIAKKLNKFGIFFIMLYKGVAIPSSSIMKIGKISVFFFKFLLHSTLLRINDVEAIGTLSYLYLMESATTKFLEVEHWWFFSWESGQSRLQRSN